MALACHIQFLTRSHEQKGKFGEESRELLKQLYSDAGAGRIRSAGLDPRSLLRSREQPESRIQPVEALMAATCL